MIGPRKSCIAVVDDNLAVLEAMENLFKSFGYEVLAYSSAVAFFEDDALQEIDCLISDIGMPHLDGFELQSRVGLQRSDLPVILITGRHDLIQAHPAAANNRGIFRKPLDLPALLETVEAVLHTPPQSPKGLGIDGK